MKSISTFLAAILMLIVPSLMQNAHAAWPILKENDLLRFVDTFPGMYREYNQLGLRIDPKTGKISGAERLKRNQAVKKILKDNGWNFLFWPKLQAITRGYALAKYDQVTSVHGANAEKFMKDLKNNRWIAREKKQELEAFYATIKQNFSAEARRLRRQVHENDLKLVETRLPELDRVLLEVGRIHQLAAAARPETKPGNRLQSSTTPVTEAGCGDPRKVTVSSVFNQRGRVDWSHSGNNLIAFDKRGADKYYDVYVMKPNGTGVRCLTCNHPDLPGKNIGQPAWHPSGRYLVIQVQKADHPPFPLGIGELATNPGAGLYNDLWVLDLKDNRATPLTDLPKDSDYGTLHPHFSHDGKRLSWSQMYRKANFFKHEGITGYWKLYVADFSLTGGQPKLVNEKSYLPGREGMFENHGFSLDNRKLVFQSNMQSNKKEGETDLYQVTLETGHLEKLTDSDFNEHGIFSPNGKKIAYMSSTGNANGGTDWWMMNPDGTCKTRLTFFNQPGHAQYLGHRVTAADMSWSQDGKRFIGYFHDVDPKNILTGKMKGEGHALVTLKW